MSTLLDSEAQFLQRTLDLKFSDDLRRSLKRNNLDTFGTFAYAHGQPGQNIGDEFEAWFTTNVLPNASLSDIAGAKRLLFESQTLVLAHLQDQVHLSDPSSTIKKVPTAERESKMALLKKRLTGLLIEGPLEPGHHLLDLAANMAQTNEIRYISPEKCITRTHEIMTQKTPTKMVDVSSDSLVVKEKSEVADMVTSSALQVQEAF